MKKIYIYALACALTAISCQDNEWVTDSTTPQVPEMRFRWEQQTVNYSSSLFLK